ncbi:MAG: rhodanese-like domain-containing protein [Candidatus Pacebacteria bacterium]|nr:rhodanese-like domain-containing protein [Candidatus Paceibacterota bacterium]
MEFNNIAYKEVDPIKAQKLIRDFPKIIIIDVSQGRTYDNEHIFKAISAPIENGSLDKKMEDWDKNEKYLVYAHTKELSVQAAKKMSNAGFSGVFRLKGEFKSWADADFSTEE